MARIGTFARTQHGFTGRLRTLSLDIELVLVPAEHSDTENTPDYRIHAGDEEGPEVGAGWRRLTADRRPHLHAAPPRQPVPIGQQPLRLPSALDTSVQT